MEEKDAGEGKTCHKKKGERVYCKKRMVQSKVHVVARKGVTRRELGALLALSRLQLNPWVAAPAQNNI